MRKQREELAGISRHRSFMRWKPSAWLIGAMTHTPASGVMELSFSIPVAARPQVHQTDDPTRAIIPGFPWFWLDMFLPLFLLRV